jgi:cardiolipin synthase A/B
MKLIIQPDLGVAPIVTAIKRAKKSIDILIFRLDNQDVAKALEVAVARGVNVRALTAHTARGADKKLRKLELQLLEGGVTVSRTADDLVRYHGKMMIVDARTLHVYGFNLTSLDLNKSRSFGVITRNGKLVQEAIKLFEADFNRQTYCAGCDRLIVSPDNARERLAKFISGARRELLIYDPNLSDDAVLKLLVDRQKAGVDIKVIGKVESKWDLLGQRYAGKRLHVRAIIRDGSRAFIGSQSLRKLELERRREVGILIHDQSAVRQMKQIFSRDWAETEAGRKEARKAAKKKEAA